MNSSTAGIGMAITVVTFLAAVAYGWIYNIVSLVGLDWDTAIGIEGVLRIIGIVVVPLGAVMGIFV